MEKLIYDAEGGCGSGTNCPKFVVDEQRQVVSLIDKQGNKAGMSIADFNEFVRAVRSGEITKLSKFRRT